MVTKKWKAKIEALRLELDLSEADWKKIEETLLKPYVDEHEGFRVIVNQFSEPRRWDVYRQVVLECLAGPMKEAKQAQDEHFAASKAAKRAKEDARIAAGRPNLTDGHATNTRNGTILTGAGLLNHLQKVQEGKEATAADKKRKHEEKDANRADSELSLLTSARGKLEQGAQARLNAGEARAVAYAFARQRGDGAPALKRLRKSLAPNAQAAQAGFAAIVEEKGEGPWPWARMLPASTPRALPTAAAVPIAVPIRERTDGEEALEEIDNQGAEGSPDREEPASAGKPLLPVRRSDRTPRPTAAAIAAMADSDEGDEVDEDEDEEADFDE